MKQYKAPQPFWEDKEFTKKKSIFLAGSIEMGKAIDWQTKITNRLKNKDVIILNPRRDDWDSSWIQSIDNPQFYEQVSWELYGLIEASIIALYFAPDTKSPISLLEMGLHATDNKLIVYCPDGFWRKGNIDVVAKHYKIPVFLDEEKWMETLIGKLSDE
jgi:hypothetical protein